MPYTNQKNYLYHHGIKGMKWGVRRYQNEDGSLTNAGKKRYGSNDSNADNAGKKKHRSVDRDKLFDTSVKNGKDKPNISPAEKITKNASNVVSDTSKILNASSRIANRRRKSEQTIDLSNMTDQQLRDYINRSNLEKQYISAISPDKTSKGKEYADDILDIAGGVAGIAGSVIGTIALIKTLKHV